MTPLPLGSVPLCPCVRHLLAAWLIALGPWSAGADEPRTLKLGICQIGLEATLAENRDKIAAFIAQAKDRGCRVVVFPETSLFAPPGTPRTEIDAAVESLRRTVDDADLYALIGGTYQRDGKEKPFERLLVIGPDGKILQTYNKMWSDARFPDCPGIFEIDGVPCAAAICADRWIRSVEELPAMAGAKILFEVSNNYDNEWLPDLDWFWYVPRAVRNEVFVVFANTGRQDRAQNTPGHGHSAVIGPDGELVASLGEESDKLLVAEIDLARATGKQAAARREHPLMKPFWETGLAILSGQSVSTPPRTSLTAPAVELKLAAAQMACSTALDENAAHIVELIYQARDGGAEVVVFPELAVTGAREADIRSVKQADLETALAMIQRAARQCEKYVVCGMPWRDGERLLNTAVAIGPDGKLLTRYAQLVLERPNVAGTLRVPSSAVGEPILNDGTPTRSAGAPVPTTLFAAGTSTADMWVTIKGVPCIITIGRDALWSELAELAALRGAQVHLHLAYDRQTTPAADLRRQQLWVNLASFRTFTATVNAASPRTQPQPSSPASGGSAIWDDYHRGQNRQAGGYGPYSAVRVAQAKQDETILYATQKIPATNPQFRILTEKTNPQMTPWFATGAAVIHSGAGSPVVAEFARIRTAGESPNSGEFGYSGPYMGGKFRGRIAYSADGNHNDPDDWAASPVALAIVAECGLKDRLVHFDYNCILPKTDPAWEKTHADSVLGTAERYGYDRKLFHDCRQNLDAAAASLAKAIDASSADDPLYFIVAGPMEVPYLAIQKAQPDKRQHVYCISHSRWNDGFARAYQFTHTKRSVIETGVHWIQIRDQNRLLSKSPYGQPAPEGSWRDYEWMRDSDDAKVRWLWERLRVSTRPDPSDAGMAWFLATGDEDCDPAKLKRLLDVNIGPTPLAARRQVRLEAENFRELAGFTVEDTNDRTASHRLQVKLTADDSGRIVTRFAQPYASTGQCDVQIRCAADPAAKGSLTLTVDGVAYGEPWQSAGAAAGWVTHVVRSVPIRAGSEIALSATGTGIRIDYVQLDR